MYSCHLFLISSASVRSIMFLSFIVPIFAWNGPLISLIFLKKNFSRIFPSLSHSILFLYFFAFHWRRLSYLSLPFFGTLHSDGYIFPFLLCPCLLFFSQIFVKPPQTIIRLWVYTKLSRYDGGFWKCLPWPAICLLMFDGLRVALEINKNTGFYRLWSWAF